MNATILRQLLENIDAIPADNINQRYGLLCELLALVKKDLIFHGGSSFRSTNILLKLLESVEAIPEDHHDRRYFQLVNLMIFVKRQARFHALPNHPELKGATA